VPDCTRNPRFDLTSLPGHWLLDHSTIPQGHDGRQRSRFVASMVSSDLRNKGRPHSSTIGKSKPMPMLVQAVGCSKIQE